MKTPVPSLSRVVALTLALSLVPPALLAAVPEPAAAAAAPAPAKGPVEWIAYSDATVTPVVDTVSRNLAAARVELAAQENLTAAQSLRTAARALAVEADRLAAGIGEATGDTGRQDRDTRTLLLALVERLDAAADRVTDRSVNTVAQLDATLDRAARADLNRRWAAADAADWSAMLEEPRRHLGAATEAYAKKDYQGAALEIRKAGAFLALESGRAYGDVKVALDAAAAELEQLVPAIERGRVTRSLESGGSFVRTDHALAVAERASAARSWARMDYVNTGYALRTASNYLQDAAGSGQAFSKEAATAASAGRAVGDGLVTKNWSRSSVATAFQSLGTAMNDLGRSIDGAPVAAPVDINAMAPI